MPRRLALFALLSALFAGASRGSADADAGASPVGLPDSMAALGDSLTRGFAWNGTPEENLLISWATGTDPRVKSHYTRLLDLNPTLLGNAANYAVTGSSMRGTLAQADAAVGHAAEYVTILSGTNDVCRRSVDALTPPDRFAGALRSTLARLSTLPNVGILVASIPNWFAHWQRFRDDPEARAAWASDSNGVCPVIFGAETSDKDRDSARRHLDALNEKLAAVCSEFPACRYDGGAAFRLAFTAADLAPDYFHFTADGEARLAAATWAAGWYAEVRKLFLRLRPRPRFVDGNRVYVAVRTLARARVSIVVRDRRSRVTGMARGAADRRGRFDRRIEIRARRGFVRVRIAARADFQSATATRIVRR